MLRWMVFFIIGLWQLFAIQDALQFWWGMHWLVAAILGFFIAQVPIIGSVVGMFGAIDVWNWSWTQAIALFFGPFITIVIFYIAMTFINKKFYR